MKIASDALARAIETEKRNKKLLESIGPAIIQALKPALEGIESAISNMEVKVQPKIEVNPQFKVPQINVPDIIIPEIKVPQAIVNYTPPSIRIPEIKMPDKMNIEGWVSLMGVSLEKPLPVQLRNPDGSPVNLLQDLTVVMGGGGGRSGGNVKVTGFDASALYYAGVINGDGRLMVETNDSGSATTIVNQVSGAIWSVNVAQQDVSQLVNQVSGANWSVTASATDLDIRDLNVVQDELLVHQVSGANWSVEVSNTITETNSAAIKTAVEIIDNAISGSEMQVDVVTMPTVTVTGSLTSVVATGAVLHDAADDGHAPVKLGGHAIQTNPTAVADGDIARIVTDDIGRPITRPVQARDLIATAYATFATGTEATLLAGTAATYYDLIYVLAANNSTAAVGIDIRPSTAGSIVMHLEIPANGVVGVSTPVPIPQQATGDGTGGTWTVDLPDITGTTVSVSALFSKEI